jgi:inner membrane protein
MLWKTHLAIGLAVALYFSSKVTYPLVFIPVVLLASIFPDIDSGFSYLGRKRIFRPVQMVSYHRGIIHSYTVAIIISVVFAFFYPIFALPFFLGYSLHLFADSFTSDGIRPFWPLKKISKGRISVGGKIDKTIFYTFVLIDLVLISSFFYNFF